ncbi:MAG TPA: serine hydrolase domain-containing protein [Pseudomonadales bacterium]|nr:serine hydrolase domain-containing protein [Pseudomonadales bacterium]
MSNDFSKMHATVQSWVDRDFLVGASSAVLVDGEIADVHHWGLASRESGAPMDDAVIFRIFSNTKLVTSVAAMMLVEQGLVSLDDAVEVHLPEFADLKVLKEGATSVEEVEPLASKPTIRQLFCHNSGLSYGLFQESIVDALYLQQGLLAPTGSLEALVAALPSIPLANQPGRRWQYSVATDVLARLIEVKSGLAFDAFLQQHVFAPLRMVDTDFWVPPEKAHRLAGNYAPTDPMDPLVPGLAPTPDALLGAYTTQRSLKSGGGGLVSTLADYTRFIRMLVNDGELDGARVLQAETLAEMRRNQLPAGLQVQLPTGWTMPETTFGLGFALKGTPAEGEPDTAIGEYHWGGLAGTHSWISPEAKVAGIIFTQRLPGFWHPFSHDFKREVYAAVS